MSDLTAHGDRRPVGVFDSGVGGLSVLRAIHDELPAEDLLYVADSGHAPYGDRPPAFIETRTVEIFEFLRGHGIKAGVVACNTATAVAVSSLRSRFHEPIVAMEPALKPAAGRTRTGVIGVLATTRTLSSVRFQKLLQEYGAGVRVVAQPCPRLVECVERGELQSEETSALVREYVEPVLAQGADTLVLGCTHYPFLRPLIEAVGGPGVTVIDPAVAVARELRRRLTQADLLAPAGRAGAARFWSSGDLASARRIIGQLWDAGADVAPLAAAPAHTDISSQRRTE